MIKSNNVGGVPTVKKFKVTTDQDYVEDTLISLCDSMEKDGVSLEKISSGLIFTMHYILCRRDNHKDALKDYEILIEQCKKQILSMKEFYELK